MATLRYVKPAPATEPEAPDTDNILGRKDWLPNSRPRNKRQFHAQVRKLADAGYNHRAIAGLTGVGLNLVRSILTGDTPEPPEAA